MNNVKLTSLESSRKKIFDCRSKHGESAHLETAIAFFEYGNSLYELQFFDEALVSYLKSLSIHKQINQESNHSIKEKSDCLICIAKSLHCLGRYKEAVESYAEAHQLLAALHQNKPHTALFESSKNLGKLYIKLNQIDEGLHFFHQAISIGRILYKSKSREKLIEPLNCIAYLYEEMNKFEEALSVYKEVLLIRRDLARHTANLGVSNSLNNIGKVLSDLGRHTEALPHHQEALSIRQILHKENSHVDIANAYSHLGRTYSDLRMNEEALNANEKALQIRQAICNDENDPSIISSSINLARSLCGVGRQADAFELVQQLLKKTIELNGPIHMNVVHTLIANGQVLYAMKKPVEALDFFNKALEMQLTLKGEESDPKVAFLYRNIVRAMVQNGDEGSASKKAEEALKFFHQQEKQLSEYEKKSYKAAMLYIELGDLYFYLKNYEDALFYNEKALEFLEIFYGNKKQQIIATLLFKIAKLFVSLRREQDACLIYEKLAEKFLFYKS